MKSPLLNLAALLLLSLETAQHCAAAILNSDDVWLRAPEAHFETELKNAGLISAAPAQKEASFTVADKDTTLEADVADLSAALSKTNSAGLVERYREIREQISGLHPRSEDENPTDENDPIRAAQSAIERLHALNIPAEFTLYLDGAAQWRLGNKSAAVKYWNDVLELPIAERHYRSVWAAYMLARFYLNASPARAHAALALVRTLAETGFADSLHLANECLGWDAAIFLKEGDFAKAFDIYLQKRDIESLRITASKALDYASAEKLQELAQTDSSRKIITACIISGRLGYQSDEEPLSNPDRILKWEGANKAAEIKDPWTVERLALAAYQRTDFEAAQAWIDASPNSFVSEWLQAKLRLRQNQIEEAANILRQLAPRVPTSEDSTDLLSNLSLDRRSGPKQFFADLGAVELNRENFTRSLEAFVRANCWSDAAFVAERVLKIDELKAYVESHPAAAALYSDQDEPPAQKLRSLLARRLMRANRIREARSFCSVDLQPTLDQFTAALQTGFDKSESFDTRAENFVEAARLTRENGMELFGTELEPDWAMHAGAFDSGLSAESRLALENSILAPSAAEIQRIHESALPFSKRYHYRYIAAELAWIASLLMPNNDDATALVLCEAGSWVKNLDPQYADKFYKSLVRRNRATELGAQADQLRWFPSLLAKTPVSPEPEAQPEPGPAPEPIEDPK